MCAGLFPSWLPVSFWTSKTLHISRSKETIWAHQMGLEKVSGHSQGHNCWTIHTPCADNLPHKTLTKMITQKHPSRLQNVLWAVFSGWWQMACTGWLPRESLLLVTDSTRLSDCYFLWFLKGQLPHLGFNPLILKSFCTPFAPISTIPDDSPPLMCIT